MLEKLHIENYAIIDQIEIDFSSKLNIITGETGAGKSILMGALSLILGERTDSAMLMNREKKCFIEGIFHVQQKEPVTRFLLANDIEADDMLILRREISSNGKSRAFINDTPATLQQLKILASMLVDLHQQFDTLELGDSDFQRDVIDALAGNGPTLESYREVYGQWMETCKVLEQLTEKKNNFNKELDYFQYLYNELEEAGFRENELEDLDHELQVLSNAESIASVLNKLQYELKESEQPVVPLLKQLANQLRQYAGINTGLAALAERLQQAQVELNDIAGEAGYLAASLQYDEQRVAVVNERIAAGYRLLKKHNVHTTAELLQVQRQLQEKLQAVLHIDDAISANTEAAERLRKAAEVLAETLSNERKKHAGPFAAQVTSLLVQVGMPNARIKVEIGSTGLQETGKDNVQFLFDANKSNRFEPLRKVASGGELSRLMLCIKSLVAERIDLPTLIFDEIDSGISGEAAKQVGIIMKQLAAKRQVISITHQPQIAGKADAHFFVYKQVAGDKVMTNIRLLSVEERITAIARMLSGERPTAAALENAREMIMN